MQSIPVHFAVYWKKDAEDAERFPKHIDNNTKGIQGSTPEMPSLIILSAKPYDSGKYTCYARNVAGEGYSLSKAVLEVISGEYLTED